MQLATWSRGALAGGRQQVPTVLVGVITVAAAAIGTVIGARLADDPAASRVTPRGAALDLGVASLQAPPSWWLTDPTVRLTERVAGQGISGPYTDARLALLAPLDASLLPPDLEARARSGPKTVRLQGGAAAWRYELVDEAGDEVSVVTAPTTSGVVTFACWTRPGGEYIGEQDCDDASRGLRVAAGEALPPAPDVAARIALPAVVDRLDARRAAGRRALARGRFSAAGDVAAAYADAAAALRPLAGGRALALTRRLGATAGAYSELERAHAQQSRGKAVRAAGRITRGEARLQALLRDLAPAAQRRAE